MTGRLEYIEGRLEYRPPCGEIQQRTVVEVVTELNLWRRTRSGFAVGSNEAGMLLGGEVRAADAAVWRASSPTSGYARVPPILAVEVSGADEDVPALLEKARWYLGHGVLLTWIVDPQAHVVHVVSDDGVRVIGETERLSEHPALPGLSVPVANRFRQLSSPSSTREAAVGDRCVRDQGCLT
ncbi:MAG: Uma2 family endonuclease [Labilithrix sp.]|nr:Uma2 family endonuclease [Labilithrix sp.]